MPVKTDTQLQSFQVVLNPKVLVRRLAVSAERLEFCAVHLEGLLLIPQDLRPTGIISNLEIGVKPTSHNVKVRQTHGTDRQLREQGIPRI